MNVWWLCICGESNPVHLGECGICSGSKNGAHAVYMTSKPRLAKVQRLPIKNDQPCIQDLVMTDIQARKQLGIQRYGTTLQPFNGRDSLRDAYEEAVDLASYLRQVIFERDGK